MTDLYALGIVAYEIFTGEVPFQHDELVPLLMMQVNERPSDPRHKNPALPAELAAVILTLLEKEPAKRFATCGELAEALTLILNQSKDAVPG